MLITSFCLVFSSPGRVPEGQERTALIAGTKVGRWAENPARSVRKDLSTVRSGK